MDSEIKIFCLKCKKYTESENPVTDTINVKNTTRKIIKAVCAECKTRKTRFLKN